MNIKLTTILKYSALALTMMSSASYASADVGAINAAVADSARVSKSARDAYRNPAETLAFFGLKQDMTVIEIWPGGGWYTEILNSVVKDKGQLIGAHFYVEDGKPAFFKRSLDSFNKKVADNPLYNGIVVTQFHPTKALDIAPQGSADMVLTFRNLHNWYMRQGDEGVLNAFKAFNKALKKGGVLGVVDHRMPEDFDQQENKGSGYLKQSYAIAMAKKAGFKLVATSEVNANEKDTAKHPKGVWTLPPRLALGEEDKAKYMAIGESD